LTKLSSVTTDRSFLPFVRSSLTFDSDSIFTLDGDVLVSPGRVQSTAASTTAKPQNEVKSRVRLDVVVLKSTVVLQSTHRFRQDCDSSARRRSKRVERRLTPFQRKWDAVDQ